MSHSLFQSEIFQPEQEGSESGFGQGRIFPTAVSKNEKVLGCYRAVDMKIPEISGAGTKAGMHTQWEQGGWRRGETFSAKKPELTHPTLAA